MAVNNATPFDRQHAIEGSLLGTAVGDALGLPYEGLSRGRGRRMLGVADRYRFLFGRGMVSDDTEHSCMVLEALVATGSDERAFARNLARRLRLWLLGLPAGVGLATLRATLRLWAGIPPERSGVFSAGNGPAMRSAVLGAAIEEVDELRRFVRASTRITHVDPKAEYGAMAVALAAHMSSRGLLADRAGYLSRLREVLVEEDAEELLELLGRAVASAARGESSEEFADSLGLNRGVSGYVYHTVPVAIHACLRYGGDFRGAVMAVVGCGGDTDTVGAIVGGIVGAGVGSERIPRAWLDGLCEWPRTVGWMRRLARGVAQTRCEQSAARALRLPVSGLAARNLFFLIVVLLHGVRRLLPPW